jgi:signal transduction histidine kinase/CheY-like chemotaxis protein
MARMVDAHDWAATPLGPRDRWPSALQTMVRTMLASNHPMFIWWGPELIQFYNDAYRETMGPERHPSALGQPGRECWQEIWPIIGPQIDSVMAGGPSTWHEDQLVPVTRHGALREVWWTYGYSPIVMEDGSAGGVLVVCNDVTDTHLAHARLAEEVKQRDYENMRQKIMFQQAPGFMCVLEGPDHVFAFTNDAYTSLVGNRDIIGKPVAEAIPEAVGQGFVTLLDEVFQTGRSFTARDMPITLRSGEGLELTPRILDFIYQPIVEFDGSVSGIFVQGNDVTERKGAELALQAADRRKDEFLAMLAHELRNPLAPITYAAQALERGNLPPSAVQATTEIILRQSRRMGVLIDDLLDASRVSRGKVTLARQPVDVHSLVLEAAEQVRPLADARQQRFRLDLGDAILPVHGDPQRIVQIIANLLDNACKYTPPGGTVELSASLVANTVRISVADNGSGIEPDLLPRLFELFSQGTRSVDRPESGLGIGLAVARSLAELHGGSIEVESGGTRQGSRFTVTLPMLQGEVDFPRHGEPTVVKTDAPARVLIVEDNKDSARALQFCLANVGHSVDVEHDGLLGWRKAVSEPADVYVLDMGLPGIDGNELARRIRSTPAGAQALVIAVSGYGSDLDRSTGLAAGVDHYFVKPVDPDRLCRVIEDRAPAVDHAGGG